MALAAPFPAALSDRSSDVRTRSHACPAAPRPVRPSRGGVVLTARGRAVVFLLAVVALLAVVLLSGRVSAVAGSQAQGPATSAVVVQQGETLWQIAQRIAPEADPRATVTAIRELNGLGGAPVVAGQTVVVPLGH